MIISSTPIETHPPAPGAGSHSAAEIEQRARQWLADNCSYQYYFKDVDFEFYKGVLTLHGRVPSFYLKQVLQSVLGEMPEITRVDNHVEVVNSVGLSSVRPK